MIYAIVKAISIAFSKMLKFFMNTKEDTKRPKDRDQCAAAEKEIAASFTELMKETQQNSVECAAEIVHAAIPVIKNAEREHASISHSVAEAYSPSHLITTSKKRVSKRKTTRTFICKPHPARSSKQNDIREEKAAL